MIQIVNQIRKKLIKLRLQAIRVFCLHHVSAEFDAESMDAGDWMQIDEFKNKVISLQKNGVKFISLSGAYKHLTTDYFRCHKYAVLTFDDGYASLKGILPWLAEQHIPVTLFINGKYLDGTSYRENPKEKYLTREELFQLTSPLIEIGSHGWEHMDAYFMEEQDFIEQLYKNNDMLSQHPRFVPFFAYTWGHQPQNTNKILYRIGYVPVVVRGNKNYTYLTHIDRECELDI